MEGDTIQPTVHIPGRAASPASDPARGLAGARVFAHLWSLPRPPLSVGRPGQQSVHSLPRTGLLFTCVWPRFERTEDNCLNTAGSSAGQALGPSLSGSPRACSLFSASSSALHIWGTGRHPILLPHQELSECRLPWFECCVPPKFLY